MAYKVLKDGVLVNTVEANLDFLKTAYPDHEYELIPPAPRPAHKTEFSPKELYDSFTTDEALLALMSSNPAVVAQAQLLTVNRGVEVSASDAGYQSAINLLEAEGVLTADRAADYRQGIPLD
jgi:hypothetical protein